MPRIDALSKPDRIRVLNDLGDGEVVSGLPLTVPVAAYSSGDGR